MAPDNTHTVFGFNCDLDWRPTVFVNGISSNRVCSACGLVPAKIAMLPCRHVLCQSCYDHCVASAGKCCLDGEDILRDDVIWSTFSVVRLLERRIRCWNASGGCNFSGPASEVIEHFSKACHHHAVPCPRCKGRIAHKDIVSHCQWGLCIQIPIVDSGTRKDVTSEVAQITTALGNLDTRVTSLQSSLQEDLRRIANDVEVSSERMSHCLPALESIHGLDNKLKESMQLSGRAVSEISEAQAALRNNTSAIMSSLQTVLDIVNELRASGNQAAGKTSTTPEKKACFEQARETLALQELTSGGDSNEILTSQNETCDKEASKILDFQNRTCSEKSSEALALKQNDICAEEVKNSLAPGNRVSGEEPSQVVVLPSQIHRGESGKTLQDHFCGNESSETLAPVNQTGTVEASRRTSLTKKRRTVWHQRAGSVVKIQARLSYCHPRCVVRSQARHCKTIPVAKSQVRLWDSRSFADFGSNKPNLHCKGKQNDIFDDEVKNSLKPENRVCSDDASQIVRLPSQMCREESGKTLQDRSCDKELNETLGPQIFCKEPSETLAPVYQTSSVESTQAIASPHQICGGAPSETSTLDQTCNKGPTETLLLQTQLCGERLRQAFASLDKICGKESSETLSSENQIHENQIHEQSQTCGDPSETLAHKKETCNVESSITSSPRDEIADQGTVLALQDKTCGKELSETLAPQSVICSKDTSDTSRPQNRISAQKPSEALARQNSACGKESSEPLAACANLKREVDELASASAAERNEIKEKLKAVEKMIQDCVRTGSMNQSNMDLFRKEFRDKMRSLGPVSKWSFNNKLNVSKTLNWTVESWSDAKAQSRLLGSKTIYPENADYFYGYRIFPSAVFETKNRFQSVTMGFQICRGTHDGLVMWPMKKTMCLMMVNPADRSRCDSIVLNTADLDGEAYDRPGDEDNIELVCGEKVSVRKLEGKGCIHNDRLALQFYIMA